MHSHTHAHTGNNMRAHMHSVTRAHMHSVTHALSDTCTHALSDTCTHALSDTCTQWHMHSVTRAHMHSVTHALSDTCTHALSDTCTHALSDTCTHALMCTTHAYTHTLNKVMGTFFTLVDIWYLPLPPFSKTITFTSNCNLGKVSSLTDLFRASVTKEDKSFSSVSCKWRRQRYNHAMRIT